MLALVPDGFVTPAPIGPLTGRTSRAVPVGYRRALPLRSSRVREAVLRHSRSPWHG